MVIDTPAASSVVPSARLSPGLIEVEACGRGWRLARPADLESLWEAMTDEAFSEDERLPYWVELWPASLALAAHLWDERERIRRGVCLDLGCGLGFTALVAAWLGAQVIGMDYEPAALSYARQNALVNKVPQPCWLVMDWRFPALAPRSCSHIWGGDIMYEKRFVEPVFAFLEHALAPEGRVWVAEPARGVYDAFQAAVEKAGWTSRRIRRTEVEPLHIQSSRVRVNLWELARATG